MPASVADALVALDGMCLTWQRWYAALEAGGARQIIVTDLPQAVQKRLARAMKAVQGLRDIAGEERERK